MKDLISKGFKIRVACFYGVGEENEVEDGDKYLLKKIKYTHYDYNTKNKLIFFIKNNWKNLIKTRKIIPLICNINDFSKNGWSLTLRLLFIEYDLYRWSKNWRPDIIHSWFLGENLKIGIALSKLLNVPATGCAAGSDVLVFGEKSKIRYLCKHSDKIIAVSKNLKNKLISLGVEDKKVVHIPTSVDIKRIKYSKKEKVENLFLSVGRLHQVKGYDILIESVKNLKKSVFPSKFKIVIAGEGEEKNNLLGKIRKYSLEEEIILLGYCKGQQLWDLYRKASVFILPSRSEGLPNALIEASASGCALIGSKVGGIPEIIEDNKNGYLFSPGNVSDLEKKMKKCINNLDLCLNMGIKSRSKAKKYFDNSKRVDKLIKNWSDLIKLKSLY